MNDNYFQQFLTEILQHAEKQGDLKTPLANFRRQPRDNPTFLHFERTALRRNRVVTH